MDTDLQHEPKSPIWRQRWFQVLCGVLVSLLVASFIIPPLFLLVYELRGVLLPVVIAFALAYVVNPAITHLQRRYRVPRWAGTSLVLGGGAFVIALFLLIVIPPMVAQGADLVLKAREVYPRAVEKLLETARSLKIVRAAPPENSQTSTAVAVERAVESGDTLPPDSIAPPAAAEAPVPPPPTTPADATDPADQPAAEVIADALEASTKLADSDAPTAPGEADPALALDTLLTNALAWLQNLDWGAVASAVMQSLDIGVGVVSGAISVTTYLMLSVVIIVFCFFYFAWKFENITGWFVGFIPASKRADTLGILRKMDHTIAAFVRGRLIQAGVMMVILTLGWLLAGVPYWLLLGITFGIANLVPFLPAVGWILAVALTVIDQTAGPGSFSWWAIVGPTLVYFVAQGVDGWIVEPVVQGQATNLDPITVLLVVLIGGSLGGLLGLLIAIPTAACIKILAKEVVLPRLRELAANN